LGYKKVLVGLESKGSLYCLFGKKTKMAVNTVTPGNVASPFKDSSPCE